MDGEDQRWTPAIARAHSGDARRARAESAGLPSRLRACGSVGRAIAADRLARVSVVALLPFLLAGCGLGGLIAGAVGIIAESSGSSSGSSGPPSAVTFAVVAPREELRASGLADVVPICVGTSGRVELDDLVVEFTLETDDSTGNDGWLRASPARPPDPSSCAGLQFWWDASSDLDLESRSERVRVRASLRGDVATAVETGSFVVGNTPPELFLVPEPPGNFGTETISFRARDAESDPLVDFAVDYRLPADIAASFCDEIDEEGSCWLPYCSPDQDTSGECAPCDGADPLPSRLLVDSDSSTRSSHRWRTACARGIGRRNISVTVRVRARDEFGTVVEDALPLRIENNTAPRVDFIGIPGERDASFEIPIFFEAFEEDCVDFQEVGCEDSFQSVDVIVQYGLRGEADVPPLDERFSDPQFRRRALGVEPSTDGGAALRAEFQIATPASSAADTRAPIDLAASPDGVAHVFVWNSGRDLDPLSTRVARIRLTPFDQGQGISSTREFTVDNDAFPRQEALHPLRGVVSGVASGDINGDGRTDIVCSFADERRLELYLRDGDGALPESPTQVLLDGPSVFTDVVIEDLDGNGHADVVALGRECELVGCVRRGVVYVFYGDAVGEESRLSGSPLALGAGRDPRSIATGNFDGESDRDIAIADHAGRAIGVLLASAPRSYFPLSTVVLGLEQDDRPDVVVAADLAGDDRDEILTQQRNRSSVPILAWENGELAPVTTLTTLSVGSLLELPTSLAVADLTGDGAVDLVVGSARNAEALVLRNTTGTVSGNEPISFALCATIPLGTTPERLAMVPAGGGARPEFVIGALGYERGGTLELVHVRPGAAARLPGADLGATSVDPCAELSVHSFKTLRVPQPNPDAEILGALALDDFDDDRVTDLLVGGSNGARRLVGETAGSLTPELLRRFDQASTYDATFADFGCTLMRGVATLRLSTTLGADGAATRYQLRLFLQDALVEFGPTPDWESPLLPLAQAEARITGLALSNPCDATIAVSRDGGVDVHRIDLRESEIAPYQLDDPDSPTGPIVLGSFFGSSATGLVRLGSNAQGEGRLSFFRIDLLPLRPAPPAAIQPDAVLPTGDVFPSGLLGADLDRDGFPDLVVLHKDLRAETERVQTRLQRVPEPWPDRLAEVDQEFDIGYLLERGDHVQVVDVDADGNLDLAFVLRSTGRFVAFRGLSDPAGSFEPFPAIETSIPPAFHGAVLSDTTGDGRPDLVVSTRRAAAAIVHVFHQQPGSTFPALPSRAIVVDDFGSGFVELRATDLTSDGRDELVLFGPESNDTWIIRTR